MKNVTLLFIGIVLTLSGFSQTDTSNSGGFGGLLKKANSIIKSGSSSTSSLGTSEIVEGLKQALSLGAEKSAGKLSTVDGFLKDAAVKILLPEEVKKLEPRLRALGLGEYVDDAVTSMNRAAENAAKTATPIFVNAVKKMTIQDALGILRGTDTAATAYLKKSTTNELTNLFRPVVDSALAKVNATKYWNALFSAYNKVALKPVTADLNEYVTDKALGGIFYYIADEEKKIRQNPSARVTDILKKVFGAK